MELKETIAFAISHGVRSAAGLTKLPLELRKIADAANGNIGTFLADLEELFPAEFAAATEE